MQVSCRWEQVLARRCHLSIFRRHHKLQTCIHVYIYPRIYIHSEKKVISFCYPNMTPLASYVKSVAVSQCLKLNMNCHHGNQLWSSHKLSWVSVFFIIELYESALHVTGRKSGSKVSTVKEITHTFRFLTEKAFLNFISFMTFKIFWQFLQ